ncbi:glycosyltransferase [Butyrivibrio sp. FCS006]|uniref:glycosyltransferase n=1 Tax=Butyrivibrio sp. FCS006 TaxID=1280684 RepID=UPI000428B81B|nr:glycosyltransferase [Butyrivibrio sp. FCS006]
MGKIIPIVIPAYEPDDKLIGLMDNLVSAGFSPIVVVNDGSDRETYGRIFDEVKNRGAIVLEHEVNRGKGRALKTAFEYCLNEFEDMLGVITADSDGQHTAPDIKKCMDALTQDPKSLVLGVRNFDESGIPARSVFGNKTTSRVMKLLTGLSISDTQTGLRGISSEFMKYLLTEKGDRFEFETNMLLATKSLGIKIVEVPISTIYLEENKSSHFNPIVDSVRIYAIFFKFLFSSLSSSVVDIALFTIFCGMMRGRSLPFDYIMLATIMARVISAVYNFLINYKVVFKSRTNGLWAAVKYAILAVCIMLLSGALVSFFHGLIPASPEFVVKIPVDCVLFLVSFLCQREIVYK